MKLEQSLTHVDSSGSKGVTFSLHEESIALIQDALINLYNDKPKAIIREIVCNAIDASLEAKFAGAPVQPVEIILPTFNNPTLEIRDSGIGMDEKFVLSRYSSFGDSTKRSSDEYVGSFGIGKFAPLSYAEQFVVESVKNGHLSVFSMIKGRGINFLHSAKTDKPNGTAIKIPIRPDQSHFDTFAKAVNYYAKGLCEVYPININGTKVEPKKILLQFGKIAVTSDSVSHTNENFIFEVGGVVYQRRFDIYPASNAEREIQEFFKDRRFIIKLNIGDVEIMRNRESLDFSDRTKAFLTNVFAEASAELQKHVNKELEKINRLGWMEWRREMGRLGRP